MARAKLVRRRQFQDVIGTGVQFKHQPDLNDKVNEIQATRPLNLEELEEHMRDAYIQNMRYELLRRGIQGQTLEPFQPRPRASPVDPEHDSRQKANRSATVQEQTEEHNRRQRMREKRAVQHPAPPEHPFNRHMKTLMGEAGMLTGRVAGAGVGGISGMAAGEAFTGDGVAGYAIGTTLGGAAGARVGRHYAERLANQISGKEAGEARGKNLLERIQRHQEGTLTRQLEL